MEQAVPVYILSGFLGSGKTTLLQNMLAAFRAQGKRPAVVMNELGDVNLDGQLVDDQIPTAELLGGCICCSIRGDLSLQLVELVQKEAPDVIIIEATGAANPMDILDGVSETSLYARLELRQLITVVDAAHLYDLYQEQRGRTYRLMQEQIRCASLLILNKTDRVDEEARDKLNELLRKWNAYAPVLQTVQCDVPIETLLDMGIAGFERKEQESVGEGMPHPGSDTKSCGHDHGQFCGCNGNQEHAAHELHHSHSHVMAYTHYFDGPVNSVEFEKLLQELPRDIYRAKGILAFSDTSGRFLFQYAYRESDFMKIDPQGEVQDVAVFIGEHFDKEEIKRKLLALVHSSAS
ncbi:GTP-binding protein [Paenibacillus sp. P96]|uniref:GTP-binding protein n=1 Tax=Paenibacillus zeirhizosphaerae TaxID=2987519 RepID=A0ABT9FRU9_9BACL|nr:GTP-binding protein [Paenibacillus sp. P96]MDP4097454.1 GTP-binding protein [Paenibacillus sp. P96]